MAFRRAARCAAAGSLGVGALAGAQAFACHAWYESPPDATGPTRGVAIPRMHLVHDVAEWREGPGGAVGQGAGRGLAAMRDAGRALLRDVVEKVASEKREEKRDGSIPFSSSGLGRRANRATRTAPPSSSVRDTLGDVSTSHDFSFGDDSSTDTYTPDTRKGDRSPSVSEGSESYEDPENRRPKNNRRKKRALLVYVLGDSLVTGAGASDAARGFGPPLPRVFAEVLADATGRPVEWRAFGKKAADVKRIREEVVPAARAAFLNEFRKGETSVGDRPSASPRFTTRSPPPGLVPDLILILCGVNDLKHAFGGRTPEAFRRELRSAVRETRAAFCADDAVPTNYSYGPGPVVVLPGMPMQLVTAFPPPLSLAAVVAGDVWDEQKRRVAAEETSPEETPGAEGDGNGGVFFSRNEKKTIFRKRKEARRELAQKKNLTVFVPKPSVARMRAVFGSNARLTAEDGVHPNELGYAAWAHLLAGEVAEVLRRRDEASEREKG